MAISDSLAACFTRLVLGILLAAPLVAPAQEQTDEAEMNAPPMTAVPPPAPPESQQPASPLTPMGVAPTPAPRPVPATPPPSRPSVAAPAITAPTVPALRPGEMMFNFQEADIQAVVKTVSQITGKNFLLDPRVKGKLTIISTQPVSKKAIYQIFLASLKAQGYTAIDSASGFIKLVPLGDAKQNADVTTGVMPRPGEQTITHVITVQYSSAAQLVPLLRPLMAPTSQISVYPPANTLIITDYADNVRNLLRIVEIIDQRGGAELAIIPLKHASALDIAEMVTRLYPNVTQTTTPAPAQQAGGEADRVTILPDLRTNSLLVRAENVGAINDLRELVEKLDVPAKVSGNTRVVYLRNADATKLAEILRGLLTGEARTQTATAAVPGRPATTAARSGAESSQIQADESTNSLIISAPDAVFNNLRAVIEKLDVRRAQVFIEALIAEITTDKASQLGVQWFVGDQKSGGSLGAVTNFPGTGAGIVSAAIDPTSLASAGGLTLGFVGETITVDGRQIRGLGALARALEEKNIANIMSTPNLLTLDNAEAKIVVGQNVPFLTGSFSQATGTGGAVNPFQTIERKDVGLTLKIKPQISEGGSVKLQIFQESSTVARATVAASDLVTNKRSLETTVVVDDGNTVVLGGLIEDSLSDNTQAVPLLGRIPLLGWLFKSNEKRKTKTNLMVFLRPIIVRSAEGSYNFTQNRYEQIRAAEKTVAKKPSPLLEGFKPVVPTPAPEKPSDEEIPSDKIFGPPNVPDSTN
ncbi:MAG: type II secretion system secretin GspD [Sulfuricaulis sp.]